MNTSNPPPNPPLTQRCGYIAIIGRPNVGKSTLLNRFLGTKLSITSRKPQTTRHAILGIKTENNHQLIFVDTPGLHKNQQKALNKAMNRAASSAMQDVDIILFVLDSLIWNEADEAVLTQLKKAQAPIIIVINKIDNITNKQLLLPHIAKISELSQMNHIVPVSSFSDDDVSYLKKEIVDLLPKAEHFFGADQLTDRSERFITSEIIREKITRQLGDEIPYNVAIEVERFKEKENIFEIDATILVERKGQKIILIGDKGARIKLIGEESRRDIERMLDKKVMLKLWVKVKSGWSDDERALKSLGIE